MLGPKLPAKEGGEEMVQLPGRARACSQGEAEAQCGCCLANRFHAAFAPTKLKRWEGGWGEGRSGGGGLVCRGMVRATGGGLCLGCGGVEVMVVLFLFYASGSSSLMVAAMHGPSFLGPASRLGAEVCEPQRYEADSPKVRRWPGVMRSWSLPSTVWCGCCVFQRVRGCPPSRRCCPMFARQAV